MGNSEADKLKKYLEEKAKQEQQQTKKQKAEPLSAYDACVLKECDRIRELVVEAQKGLEQKQTYKSPFH